MLSPFQAALAETWSLFALGTIFIALRIFARTRMVGVAGFHPDDYMIFFAWASCSTNMYGARTDAIRLVTLG
jgi:hypothetical protein